MPRDTHRLLVAFAAVCVGALTAAADAAVSFPELLPHQRGVRGRRSPEEEKLLFDACITFYGVTYATGRLLYKWLGRTDEAELLQRWSRWHMALLNTIGSGWLILGGWNAGVLRPSLVVGVLLLGLAACDGWRSLRHAFIRHE